jgi:hypothetical protein
MIRGASLLDLFIRGAREIHLSTLSTELSTMAAALPAFQPELSTSRRADREVNRGVQMAVE